MSKFEILEWFPHYLCFLLCPAGVSTVIGKERASFINLTSAEITLGQGSPVIHENIACRQIPSNDVRGSKQSSFKSHGPKLRSLGLPLEGQAMKRMQSHEREMDTRLGYIR